MCRPARSAAIVSKAISEAQQEYEDQEMPMPPKQPFKRRYVNREGDETKISLQPSPHFPIEELF